MEQNLFYFFQFKVWMIYLMGIIPSMTFAYNLLMLKGAELLIISFVHSPLLLLVDDRAFLYFQPLLISWEN